MNYARLARWLTIGALVLVVATSVASAQPDLPKCSDYLGNILCPS